ncbi:RNA polymerase sigma factor [Sphingomonas lycopersici]|uniref:RNA polymerase sigma factor 70 region 4 type 2 domain-containing protein n=1 Tax=Sphingomonas lycopersici TaxID=2951807 RepID=A0AA41ZCP7_9SPHN|nr:sigma factor-like helix-turn-helix DNA-binding protein [Sphingomonas lycopersici]MCW6536922.1 hypothetical protein [Sphingomonas lycopersici]
MKHLIEAVRVRLAKVSAKVSKKLLDEGALRHLLAGSTSRPPLPANPIFLPSDLLAITRAIWALDHRVCIDEHPAVRVDRYGMWIGAWLHAGSVPIGADRLADAISALPLLAREIYLLHVRDRLGLDAIASRLGVPESEVRIILADALMLLDRHLAAGPPDA